MKISKATDLILAPARNAIRRAIAENDGGEVFFIGKVDADLFVCDVEAHAFGGKNTVPVLLRLVEYGDVVLHNHPGGDLEPSEADVDSAAALADLGVASYIVDNECENIHVIVRPLREKGLTPISKTEILPLLSPDGLIAEKLPQYEYRPQQISMADAIIEACNEDKIAVIEAGTGTGKSLAYLIPAIKWSVQNKERVIVSTNTINLQEQLINKDLPFLKEKAGLKFRSELMKGRQNYICLRRVDMVKRESLLFESPKDREIFQTLFDWAQKTKDGSLSDLNIRPPDETWTRICCEPETCLRIRCKFYEDCFFYKARRRAARADILVVNHHLLMADLALRKMTGNYTAAAVLPPFNRIVFDEAHNVEDVATNYFTVRITRLGIRRHLGRLAARAPGRKERGILFSLSAKLFSLEAKSRSKLIPAAVEKLRRELIPVVYSTASLVDAEFGMLIQAFLNYARGSAIDSEENIKLRITGRVAKSSFWQDDIHEGIARIGTALHKFSSGVRAFLEELTALPKKLRQEITESAVEVSAIKERLELVATNLNFFYQKDEGYCKWIEYRPGKEHRPEALLLCIAPIDIRESMRGAVYDVNRTVIMTSATLTVEKKFDFILDRLGLKSTSAPRLRNSGGKKSGKELAPAQERLLTRMLGTPFDYDRQAFVGVATDVPEPSAPEFAGALEPLILKAINISKGKTFVLFTSYRLMNRLFGELSPMIEEMGYLCLKQGQEPRHKLLGKFKRDINSVLFATASFWEGVDVKGKALECLILTRLPFKVPTEPILQARAEALQNEGRDPFMELDLPQAVIKFKQGFGRLIRSCTDRGAVLIFDRRVATKYYGLAFLRSLPTEQIHKLPSVRLFKEMKAFFHPAR